MKSINARRFTLVVILLVIIPIALSYGLSMVGFSMLSFWAVLTIYCFIAGTFSFMLIEDMLIGIRKRKFKNLHMYSDVDDNDILR